MKFYGQILYSALLGNNWIYEMFNNNNNNNNMIFALHFGDETATYT
jgi:hypothetical protein